MKIIFILKAVGLSILVSIFIGIVAGLITSIINPPHAHQVLPDWLMYSIILSIIGLIVSTILSIIFMLMKFNQRSYIAIITLAVCIITVLIFELT